ncbi:MAG: DUF5131 family protein [Pseudomonadota bacterium]
MAETHIEWATHAENYQAGCTKKSPACRGCYAIPMSIRIANMGGPGRYDGVTNGDLKNPQWTGKVVADLDALRRIFQGLRSARKPRRVFLNSMTDTFHEDAPEEALDLLAAELRTVPDKHVVMLLTKRPERMAAWALRHFPDGLPNTVWCGTTLEDQRRADERIPHLLQVPVRVRFLSMEPLLGPVDLRHWIQPYTYCGNCGEYEKGDHYEGTCKGCGTAFFDFGSTVYGYDQLEQRREGREEYDDRQPLNWVIVGGESGAGARPMETVWAHQIIHQCRKACVPVFVKQMGTVWAKEHGCKDKKGGNISEWPGSLRVREMPS